MAKRVDYAVHPLLAAFPSVEGAEFEALKADLEARGQIIPIARLVEGRKVTILDGRARLRACQELGREPAFIDYDGADAAGYVVSSNLARRHLTESQRQMVAARLATLGHGGDRVSQAANSPDAPPTQAEAADMLAVGERGVRSARVVLRDGTPRLIQAVERGLIAVSRAEQLLKRSPKDIDAVLERVESGGTVTAMRRRAAADGPEYDVVLCEPEDWDSEPMLPLKRDAHAWVVCDPSHLLEASRYLRSNRCHYAGMLVLVEATGDLWGGVRANVKLALRGQRGVPELHEDRRRGMQVGSADELRQAIVELCPGERLDVHGRTPGIGFKLTQPAARRARKPARAAARGRK